MKVVLLERVAKLGQMGDIVSVKDGYARNFLLPQKKALWASEANIAQFESDKAQLEARNLETKKEAEALAEKLGGQQFIVIRQASDGGSLYGSVTTRDAAEAATAAGFSVDRRQVSLIAPIKELGLHPVLVTLHPEVECEIEMNVARSTAEAELQAAGINIMEQAAEEEAQAELEIAELFEDIGAAELDDLERSEVIAEAIFEEETESNILGAIGVDGLRSGEDKRSQDTFPALNGLQASIKSGISSQWGDSAAVVLCHKIIDHLDSFVDEAKAPFSYKKIEMLVDAASEKHDILVALNILTTSEFAVFRTFGIFFDEEDNSYQLDSSEFRSVITRNQLMHPRTGEAIEDPESRVEPVFQLRNSILEIVIGSLTSDGVVRSSEMMKGQ